MSLPAAGALSSRREFASNRVSCHRTCDGGPRGRSRDPSRPPLDLSTPDAYPWTLRGVQMGPTRAVLSHSVNAIVFLVVVAVAASMIVSCGPSVKSQYDARVASCQGRQGADLIACYRAHPISGEPAECMQYRRATSAKGEWMAPLSDSDEARLGQDPPNYPWVEAHSLQCDIEQQAETERAKGEEAERAAKTALEQEKSRVEAERGRKAAALEEEQKRKALAYQDTIDACAAALSTAPCESRAQWLDGDQKRSCADDCRKALKAKEDELLTESVRACTDSYVETKGAKPPVCNVEHGKLGADNETLKRITAECKTTCKKEAPSALAEARRQAKEAARERAAARARRAKGGRWCVFSDRSRQCICGPKPAQCWTDATNVGIGMGKAAEALVGSCSPCSD